jgi:branched-chain amino acid transport system permease protein
MMIHKKVKWVLWGVMLILLTFYPKLVGLYFTNVFVHFAIFALYAVSFNLLLGYTGLFSFGHAMYFGTGGFATALALIHIKGCSLLVALFMGFFASVILALVLCPIVSRVSGTAFAMLHLAFSMLIYTLALKLRKITNGEDGVSGFPIPALNIPGVISFDMKDTTNFYYFAVVIIGISLWLLWFFTKTPFGQLMVSVRDNAKRVAYMGFKVPQTKAVIYAISAGFAGIAGAVLALFQDVIAPDLALGPGTSFQVILITMVGGMGSFFGPIWGSAIFTLLQEFTSRYIKEVELLMGVILIVVMLYFPKGFAGVLALVGSKVFGQSPEKTTAEDDRFKQ